MTGQATLAYSFMLKNKWSTLCAVALEARFVLTQESKPTALESLLNIRPSALHCHPHMRVMAIGAAHFAFQNRMAMRQLETCSHFEVTLETSFRRFARIDNSVRRASAFYMQTARTMARLAADVLGILPLCFQSRVGRRPKITCDILMTRLATF